MLKLSEYFQIHQCILQCPVLSDQISHTWIVEGWINLLPGESQTRPNPTDNRWIYCYAEADDGKVWGGVFAAQVKRERFRKCTCLGTTSPLWYIVGMEEFDLRGRGGVNFIA